MKYYLNLQKLVKFDLNYCEITVCCTCFLPFVIFGFKVVDGAVVEVVEGVNVDLGF